MFASRREPPRGTGHRPPRHAGRRSLALIVAVKVAIVVVVLALPSWLAISLGAAHGVALVLVAVAVVVLLLVGRPRPGGTTVLTTESRIETANANGLLAHLCRHAVKMGEHPRQRHTRGTHARPDVLGVESSDTDGTLDLSWGRCVLHAEPDALTVRVEAATEEHLRGIQGIVTADLERFGHRDNVTVTWSPPAVRADEVG